MVIASSTLDRLAALLAYPGEGYFEEAELCRQALAETHPEAARHLAGFTEAVRGLTTEKLQELFTRTFDLNPVCALEVGWQLYGDEYKRGEFLVRMRQTLSRYDLPPSVELPYHLTRVLQLLARLAPEEAEPFARHFVAPAVAKMLAGLEGKGNPFEGVLRAISNVVLDRSADSQQEVQHE